ncbi:MAG: redox-sensing transcriptional repressor Rex [Muribaculaceae bacterium]|nr:redox-sensing transcriptional repressor Rex [Muribaculaceae bacterium]
MTMMENEKRPAVPEPAIGRLPWYLACVSKMRADGVEYVSSTAISQQLNVDASQIAKDLSYLNIKGKTRIGYDVVQLEEGLNDFLGFHRRHKAVMMGVGSLGRALITDSGLSRYGLEIVAGFDIDPAVTGREIGNVPIFDISRLPDLRSELGAEIAIIAVPAPVAADVARICISAGIKALWNFTPFHIKADPGIIIQNTSIYAHLAMIYNRMPDR